MYLFVCGRGALHKNRSEARRNKVVCLEDWIFFFLAVIYTPDIPPHAHVSVQSLPGGQVDFMLCRKSSCYLFVNQSRSGTKGMCQTSLLTSNPGQTPKGMFTTFRSVCVSVLVRVCVSVCGQSHELPGLQRAF